MRVARQTTQGCAAEPLTATGSVLVEEALLDEPRAFLGEPGRPVRVTISIGIASYPDERVSDGDSLLRLADTHLYRAKSDGRNRFRD